MPALIPAKLPGLFRGLVLLAVLALGRPARAEDPAATGRRLIPLEAAYDLALDSDQSIRIAYLEVRKARLLPWSALTRVAPQLSGRASYGRSERATTAAVTQLDDSGLGTITAERTSRSRSGSGEFGLSFQQPLIDLTVFPAYRFGRLSTAAARLQHQFTVRGVLFGVASAYYEVLKQQRLVDVNRETLRLAGQQLDIAQKRADVGEVTRSDVLRAQVTLETARRTLVESENVLEFNRNTLGNILNLAPNDPYGVVEPPNYPTTLPPFDELLARAEARREDLRVAGIAIEQDIARRGQILGEYAPRVTANFDTSRGHTSGTSTQSSYDWQASVAVSVPFFTGGQREIDLRTADRQIEQTKLAREQAAKDVESEVKQAWLTVRSLSQTIKTLHIQVVAAEQGYRDLENQYRAGTATSVDVLSALSSLNTSRKDLAVQTYDYQVALRNLEQVSGVFQETRVQRRKTK